VVVPVVESLVQDYFGIPLPLSCGPSEGIPPPRASDEASGGPEAAATPAINAPGAAAAVPEDPGQDDAVGADPAAQPPIAAEGGFERDPQRWLEALFAYLFYDLKGDCREIALQAAPRVSAALRQVIRRSQSDLDSGARPAETDDVLSRCLRLRRSGTPGLDDETLRVNLTGFLVGAMTPLINATCQVVDGLLEWPEALRQAQTAARAHDDEALLGCVLEALRFWPVDPVIYRWTLQDSWLGEGSVRCSIPRGTLVMAWNAAAMFDPAVVQAPWQFRAQRPPGSYLHWGHGQHRCAGASITMAVIPGILGPLLRLGSLSRAAGATGQPQRQGGKEGITIRSFALLVHNHGDGAEIPGRGAGGDA
jgi:cytochrome P450